MSEKVEIELDRDNEQKFGIPCLGFMNLIKRNSPHYFTCLIDVFCECDNVCHVSILQSSVIFYICCGVRASEIIMNRKIHQNISIFESLSVLKLLS